MWKKNLAALACGTGLFVTAGMSKFRVDDSAAVEIADLQHRPKVQLTGHLHPMALSGQDFGALAPSQKLSFAVLFGRTASQQAALEGLLRDQQDPKSSRFHKWITPAEYAGAYGLSEKSVEAITNWLNSKGAVVRLVAPSRNRISFEATAAQAEALFDIQLRNYRVNGELHYSNNGEPSVPDALSSLLVGIRGLNDFRLKPRSVRNQRLVQAGPNPNFTSSISGNKYLAPDDFATIYDVKALYNSGIDGTGRKIAVAGQTDIQLTDIEAFRTASGLTKNDPQVVLDGTDPGTNLNDMTEADLDLEWSGAVAKNATVLYVNSTNVLNSFEYAITQNLAPVLSISYGGCESSYSSSDAQALESLTQQANAQGMTITAPSGDSGAADCDSSKSAASQGLTVDLPASLPYVTGVGGTRFVEGNNTSQYWSTANNTSNGSALSYIPGEGWNDTAADSQLSASGGGASSLFAKPSWQTGTGVPSDGHRDVPDLALSASADHDGYLLCTNGNCTNGFRAADNTLTVAGGTSAGAPTFAGIVALLSQKEGSAQGNINATLYALASGSPATFHDITTGNNIVPCTTGTTNCTTGSLGYSAGTGYDQVTGLGSIDAFNLVSDWPSSAGGSSAADFGLSVSPATITISRGSSSTVKLSVTAVNSFSGTVTLSCSDPATFSANDCTISQTSVATPGTATITIGTLHAAVQTDGEGMQASARTDSARIRSQGIAGLASGVALFVLLVSMSRTRFPQSRMLVALGVCAALLGVRFAGCGGASSSSSAASSSVSAGSYTFVITGQSGTLTHSASIQVTVQ
jgi:subtilase family serine protease